MLDNRNTLTDTDFDLLKTILSKAMSAETELVAYCD